MRGYRVGESGAPAGAKRCFRAHGNSDIRGLLDEMRLFKGIEELEVMRRAAEISCGATGVP